MQETTAVATKFDTVQIEAPTNVLKIARPGLTLLHDRKMNFDHYLCEKIIGYKEMPGDRPLRPNHVHYLINTMMRGTFHQEWVRLITCVFEKETWRMNGQHTAMARLEMPKNWKDAGQVGVMTYEATSMDVMRELYSSIDRGAPRTKSNVISSYLEGTDQFDKASSSLIRLLGEGMSFWLWEGVHERSRHDADEIAYLMQHQYKTLVDCVVGFCLEEPKVGSCDYLRRASVIAAIFETFSKVHQASADFWRAIKTGVGFDSQDDPRLRLRNALMNTKTSTPDSVRVKSIDRESMYRWCILAFNTWRKGEPMKNLRSTKERQRAK